MTNAKRPPKAHFFPLYPSDFLSDIGHVGNAELGIYWRLLLVYYRDKRPLPFDTDRLRRLAMAFSPEEFKLLDGVMLEFFQPDAMPDGSRVWRHHRADMEIRLAEEKVALMSEGGRKTAAKRWGHDSLANSLAIKEASSPPNSPLTNSRAEQKELKSMCSANTGFDDFWQTYPHYGTRSSQAKCLKLWKSMGLATVRDRVLQAVRASAASHDFTKSGGEFVPGAQVWLGKRLWEQSLVESTGPRIL